MCYVNRLICILQKKINFNSRSECSKIEKMVKGVNSFPRHCASHPWLTEQLLDVIYLVTKQIPQTLHLSVFFIYFYCVFCWDAGAKEMEQSFIDQKVTDSTPDFYSPYFSHVWGQYEPHFSLIFLSVWVCVSERYVSIYRINKCWIGLAA